MLGERQTAPLPTSPESLRKDAKGTQGGEGIVHNQDRKLSFISWPAQLQLLLATSGLDWILGSWISICPAPRGLVHNQLEISLAEHPILMTSEKVSECRAGA